MDTKKLLKALDLLCEATGTKPFSESVKSMTEALSKEKVALMTEQHLSEKEADSIIEQVPNSAIETIGELFSSTFEQMQSFYDNPENIKKATEALRKENGNNK